MPLVTETTQALVNGRPATLQTTMPDHVTDTLEFSVDLSTSGVTQDVNIALVIDVSGSVNDPSGSDLDGDGDIETVLEAQVLAAKALFQSFVDAGYDASELEVSLFAYNGSATHIGDYNTGEQGAFETALGTFTAGGQTNFDAALQEVIATWQATTADADPDNDVDVLDTNHIVFLSDGDSNGPNNFTDELSTIQSQFNGSISAIGVGAGSNLALLNQVDTTGGASQITDISQLSQAIIDPPPPLADLTGVEIVIDGVSYGTYTPGDGTLTKTPLGYTINGASLTGYPYVPGDTLNVEFVAHFNDGTTFNTSHPIQMQNSICFAPGTLIETDAGPRPIESLRPGDVILCRDGPRVLLWVGATKVTAGMLQHAPQLRPVRIRANAFGPGTPFADLMVSPQHRILIDSVHVAILLGEDRAMLAGARMLVNGREVTVAEDVERIDYWHLIFARHEIVRANGLWAESLLANARNLQALDDAARKDVLGLFPGLADGTRAAEAPRHPEMRRHEAELYWMLAQKSRPGDEATSPGSRAA